jgi:hypothetical protein
VRSVSQWSEIVRFEVGIWSGSCFLRSVLDKEVSALTGCSAEKSRAYIVRHRSSEAVVRLRRVYSAVKRIVSMQSGKVEQGTCG